MREWNFCHEYRCMIHLLTVRVSVLAMSIAVAISTHASVNAVTDTVKGRPATVSNATITNQSAPGLNPAQGDVLEVTYDYSDPDALPEDKTLSVYGWMADGSAAGEPLTGDITFVPGASQLEKFLTVQITAAESAPSDPDRATMVESAPTAAPVLPPRAEFESLYHFSSGAHMRWGDAYMYCANRNERLMTTGELQELFVDFTRATSAPAAENNGDLSGTYGVGLNNVAWATTGSDSYHDYVYIATDGHISGNSNATTVEVACAKFGGAEGLPTVTNVNVPDPVIGTALTATYTYNGNATIPDRSRFQWYRADDASGTGKTAITGATTVTYTPVAEDAGKWLIIEITPASYDTVVGTVASDSSNIPLTGLPDATQSVITATPDTILADGKEQSVVMLTLKDSQGNLLPGQNVSSFYWSNDPQWVGSVIDNGDGTYTQALKAFQPQEINISAASVNGLKLDTADIIITATPLEQSFPSSTTLEANGHDFGIDSGFPTTGFTQARFQVQISGNASNNSGYTWSTDQSWATVDNNGTVTFTGSASGGNKALKITASNSSATYSKTINLNKWFTNGGAMWSDASMCASEQVPSSAQLTKGYMNRAVDSLWSEWGDLRVYSGSGFQGGVPGMEGAYFTNERSGSAWVTVLLDSGIISSTSNSGLTVCVQGL